MAPASLYLHIPFCVRKCPYCDFYSLEHADDALLDRYTQKLCGAIAGSTVAMAPLQTVYFGGGTPSLLGAARLARILDAAAARWGLASGAELTIECNPQPTLPAMLPALRAAGLNRLSLGMQAAQDTQLARLGRAHTLADVRRAAAAAHACGFENLSLDLMLATPGQTLGDIAAAAALCDTLGAAHVSAYLLKIEPGTPFARQGVAQSCPDEDGQADAYLHACACLEAHGFAQYEISNFARPGYASRHNCNYWLCGEYLGLGPSAHSLVEGRRFYFPRNIHAFLEADDPFSLCVPDGTGGDGAEQLLLGLRLSEGVALHTLPFSAKAIERARKAASPLARGGLLTLTEDRLALTRAGFLLSNSVIAALLDELAD